MAGMDSGPGYVFPEELRERYHPVRCLGVGGMGAVFEAVDRHLERRVAIKLTLPVGSPVYFKRFQREAEVLARLDHPNIVRIYASGSTALVPYMVMEYLDGESMESRVGRFTDLQPMLQVASGLEEVHRAGLTHRDIKPGNLIMTSDGRAVLVDFGIVFDPEQSRMTKIGTAVGTAGFLAPELYAEEDPSPRSDWFAWGVTLFYLCEGRLPFTGQEIMSSLGTRKLPLLRFERIKPNRRPAQLIRRCLAWDPEQRTACLDEVLAVLRIEGGVPLRPRGPEPEPVAAPPPSPRPEPLASVAAAAPSRPPDPTYPGLDPPRRSRLAGVLLLAGLAVLLATMVLVPGVREALRGLL